MKKKKTINFKIPIDATWKNKDFDQPVKLTGFSAYKEEIYFFIEGSKTGIPYREVFFKDDSDHLLFSFLVNGRLDKWV